MKFYIPGFEQYLKEREIVWERFLYPSWVMSTLNGNSIEWTVNLRTRRNEIKVLTPSRGVTGYLDKVIRDNAQEEWETQHNRDSIIEGIEKWCKLRITDGHLDEYRRVR